MLKELALFLGLTAAVSAQQFSDDKPSLHKNLFSVPINKTLVSHNYVESYQDRQYLNSSLSQKVFRGTGLYGAVNLIHDSDIDWKPEYGLGIGQEVSSNNFCAQAYFIPLWYDDNGRIDNKVLGAYAEVHPAKNITLRALVNYKIDKRLEDSAFEIGARIGF